MERARQEERKRLAEVDTENMQIMMQQLREVIMPLPRLDRRMEETAVSRGTGPGVKFKIARLSDADDIEAYLTTFEHLMTVDSIDLATWAIRQALQLAGRAQQAYAAMREFEATDYDKMKEAILRHYNISQQTYRQRFRCVQRKGESYAEFIIRLEDLLQKSMKGCKEVRDVLGRVLVEQLLSTMPEDLRIWVSERQLTNGLTVGELADNSHGRGARELSTKNLNEGLWYKEGTNGVGWTGGTNRWK